MEEEERGVKIIYMHPSKFCAQKITKFHDTQTIKFSCSLLINENGNTRRPSKDLIMCKHKYPNLPI